MGNRSGAGYEPVVLGDTMFVPSMVTDSVTALGTATGEERWRFFAEGPVRFAPVAWEDKVYFVSDDGYLYCVRAEDGALLWRFRGLPEDRQERRVLGDGRLISLWPARGGPVLSDGVIYFAAGLFPTEGVFVHAADWSHEQANAASTGASKDQCVGSDLSVLWFDGRHRWHKFWFDTAGEAAYRSHETHQYPGHVLVRVAGGRRILLEEGLLHASDVYTGRTLWETEVPIGVKPLAQARARDAIRLQRQQRWSPPAGLSPTTELVALEDAIYISEAARCLVFDAATGEFAGRIDLPGDLQEPWANLRVTGRVVWERAGGAALRYSPSHERVTLGPAARRGTVAMDAPRVG